MEPRSTKPIDFPRTPPLSLRELQLFFLLPFGFDFFILICSTIYFFIELKNPQISEEKQTSILNSLSIIQNLRLSLQKQGSTIQRWYMGKHFYTVNILYLTCIGTYFFFYFKFFKWDPAPYQYRKDNRDFFVDYLFWYFFSIIYPLFKLFLSFTKKSDKQNSSSELFPLFLLLMQVSYYGVIFLYVKNSWKILSSHFLLLFRNKSGDSDKKRVKFFFTKICYFLASDIIVSSLLLRLIEHLVPSHSVKGENQVQIEAHLKTPSIVSVLISAIQTLFFAPIIEELIYRRTLLKSSSFHPSAIAISAFTFGMIHIQVEKETIFRLFPYAIGGAIFAWSYKKYKNIWITIFIHFFHNLISIILFWLNR